jgi:chemotaxis response regulator CheB
MSRVVLVVDDALSVLEVTTMMVENLGCIVLAASSGKDALEMLSKRHLDILIADIDMPGMKGTDLAQQATERLGQPVWTYHDPLVERLRRVGVSNQKVEDFSAWRRTISSLTSVDSRDENQLAKIVAGETAGLTLLAELVASLRKGTHQSREATVQSEAIAA